MKAAGWGRPDTEVSLALLTTQRHRSPEEGQLDAKPGSPIVLDLPACRIKRRMFVGLFAFCYSSSDKDITFPESWFCQDRHISERRREWIGGKEDGKKCWWNTLGKLLFKAGLQGFPGGSVVENLPANAGDGFNSWFRKIPHAAEQLNPRGHHSCWACAREPVSRNSRVHRPRARAPQEERPQQREARAPTKAPHSQNKEKFKTPIGTKLACSQPGVQFRSMECLGPLSWSKALNFSRNSVPSIPSNQTHIWRL